MSNQQQRPPATRGAAARTATSTTNLPAQANTKAIDVTGEEPARAIDRFVAKIRRNFQGASELEIPWTKLEQRLAMNLAVKIEMQLEAYETKRLKAAQGNTDYAVRERDKPPFRWENCDVEAAMLRAKAMIAMHLDANLPNHINAIPYLNGRTGKYELRIAPGYEGALYAKPKFSVQPIKIVICGLICDGDEFDIEENENGGQRPVHIKPKGAERFKIRNIYGGYGWIRYEDPALDRVIEVDEYRFKKAQDASKNREFWGGRWEAGEYKDGKKLTAPVEDDRFMRDMMYKTVIWETLDFVQVDPDKINTDAWMALEAAQLDEVAAHIAEDIAENANTKELPERTADPVTGEVREQGEPAPAGSTKPLF